jgi:hypothetical protein
MHIVAGTFASQEEARIAVHDIEEEGIAPVHIKVIQSDDRKGFERAHAATRTALKLGTFAGALFGVLAFGIPMWLAGANFGDVRYMALFLGGIATCTILSASLFAAWNMGVPHVEALLYEEAKEKGTVIAAIEVEDPMEDRIMHSLELHGGHDISSRWEPREFKLSQPHYN